MATIRDVARRAGVSAASVSRVLKNDTTFSVSQKTRERILEAAGELGYNKCFEYSAIQGTRGIAKKTTHPGCQAFKQKPNAKKETIASNGVTDEIFFAILLRFFRW